RENAPTSLDCCSTRCRLRIRRAPKAPPPPSLLIVSYPSSPSRCEVDSDVTNDVLARESFECGLADALQTNELDRSARRLLVGTQGGREGLAAQIGRDLGGQPAALEEPRDAPDDLLVAEPAPVGDLGRRDHADRDRLAVQKRLVVGEALDRVADGVTEV